MLKLWTLIAILEGHKFLRIIVVLGIEPRF
jgi:hypothetical protein